MSYARNAEITANTVHKDSDGDDHGFVDQDVTDGSSPTLDGANITGVDASDVDIADGGGLIAATDVEGALAENRTLLNSAVQEGDTTTASMSFVLDEDALSSDSATKLATQQSIKAYVDASVASEVSLQGDYNASANTPDLDVSPSGVEKGDHYVVSVAGVFFTETVEAGDSLIAKQDNPTTLAHWIVAQTNLTAASIKAQYESNADTNVFDDTAVSKLSGIETSADVTDATNVAAAGAVMDADVIDEDNMASDSATKVPTQQSVKAYVDSTTALDTVVTKTTNYTLSSTDDVCICTTGTFTVTLPTAVGITGRRYIVKNANNGVITLDGSGVQTIDGVTDHALNEKDSLTVISDGSNWAII